MWYSRKEKKVGKNIFINIQSSISQHYQHFPDQLNYFRVFFKSNLNIFFWIIVKNKYCVMVKKGTMDTYQLYNNPSL